MRAFPVYSCFVPGIFIIVLFFTQCSLKKEKANERTDVFEHIDASNTAEGTAAMIRMLKDIYFSADPLQYHYLNTGRADTLEQRLEEVGEAADIQLRYHYASELLFSGQTEAAINVLNEILESIRSEYLFIHDESKILYELLASAHLYSAKKQYGMENLSILNQSVDDRGTDEEVKKALEIYQRVLETYPEDLGARWLFNITSMYAGKYPQEVPSEWLIPLKSTPANFPKFDNIANAAGANVNSLKGGCSLEDFNNDGWLDVLVTSYRLTDQIRLFVNKGNGPNGYSPDGHPAFQDQTQEAGLSGLTGGNNAYQADYNNDGFTDVLIVRGGSLGLAGKHPNSLLKNNGDGPDGHPTFEDVTEKAGLLSYYPTGVAAWGDFNNDGWLDLFVGNESAYSYFRHAQPSELFVNNRDGTFTEIGKKVGLSLVAFVHGSCWGDVNNDGFLDLYVSIAGKPNRLFLNKGGTHADDWKFEDISLDAGVEAPLHSSTCWFWDYNNDGWEDIFVAGFSPKHDIVAEAAAEYLQIPYDAHTSRLYQNNGDNTGRHSAGRHPAGRGSPPGHPAFADVTVSSGLDKSLFASGANYEDLDNDGFPDLYVGTGNAFMHSRVPNRMFRNKEGKFFEEVTLPGNGGYLDKGNAVAFGDWDNDGDQDIYCVMGGSYEADTSPNLLLQNPGNDHAWITILLKGSNANRSAIGARLKTTTLDKNGKTRYIFSTVSTGGSHGASSLQQEIGLGDAAAIKEIEIIWPNQENTKQKIMNPPMHQKLLVKEGDVLQ